MLVVAGQLFLVLAGLLVIDNIPKLITGQRLTEILADIVPNLFSFVYFVRDSFTSFAEMLPTEIGAILGVFISIMFIFLLYKFFKGVS